MSLLVMFSAICRLFLTRPYCKAVTHSMLEKRARFLSNCCIGKNKGRSLNRFYLPITINRSCSIIIQQANPKVFARKTAKWPFSPLYGAQSFGLRPFAPLVDFLTFKTPTKNGALRSVSHFETLFCALKRVLYSSMVMVMGPTPPGTGVM